MKRHVKFFVSLLASAFLLTPAMAGCGPGSGGKADMVDYVSMCHLDFTSETKKQEVTVKLFIDGDTTHFDPVENSTITDYAANKDTFDKTYGYIKARYLAVNTPESTGDVEKWGKTASNFTRSKLESAQKIIVESDDELWNIDSTGERYTVWVWYLPEGGTEYRNLNIELLQNGYGFAQNTGTNRYGEAYAMPALMQAKELGLKVYSDEVDENFYEGGPLEITLKQLRCRLADYTQKTVRVEGVITTQMENSVYIEDYDEETGLYFGMTVFYGYTPGSYLRKILTIGNRVSVCGTFSNSDEFGPQISGLTYNPRDLKDPKNTFAVTGEDGNVITGEASFVETPIDKLVNGKTTIELTKIVTDEEGNRHEEPDPVTLDYGEAVLFTTVSMRNLIVYDTYTTHNGGENDGAISLSCYQLDENGVAVTVNGKSVKVTADSEGKPVGITVRTTVLTEKDENGDQVLVTADRFKGKTLDVRGFVDRYDGEYQIKVHLLNYLTIVE